GVLLGRPYPGAAGPGRHLDRRRGGHRPAVRRHPHASLARRRLRSVLMNTAIRVLAVLTILSLAACDRAADRAERVAQRLEAAAAKIEPKTSKVADQVREEMAAGNLRLKSGSLPTAEIAAAGELLIGGQDLGQGQEQ